MSDDVSLRLEMPSAGAISQGCQGCFLKDACGGLRNGNLFLNCFNQFCCGGTDCDNVCPYKPEDYRRRMSEIGGLRFDDISVLRQLPIELPRFVPMIHHGYRRSIPLKAEAVALDPYMICRWRDQKYAALTTDPVELRRHFKVANDAMVILRGTADDRFIERYWEYRRSEDIAGQLAKLGISLFIGPNYSHFLDVPRSDPLYNRKRQLICLAELSEAGLSVAPNLSATTSSDWDYWSGFLKDQKQLAYVAVNFQTGYRIRAEGLTAIDRVARIQEQIGRNLSLVLIGGGQFVKDAAKRFASFTLIDSQPFKQSLYRKRFAPVGSQRQWKETFTLERQPLDNILLDNVNDYAAWVLAHQPKGHSAPPAA